MLLLVAPSKRTCNNYNRNRTNLSEMVTVLVVCYKNCSHIMEKSLKSVSHLMSARRVLHKDASAKLKLSGQGKS